MTTYGYLRNSFNTSVSGGASFGPSSFSTSAFEKEDKTPKGTILNALAGHRMGDFKVDTKAPKEFEVSANKSNAASQVNPNMQAVENIQTDVQQAKGNISSTIATAQKQVIAATKALGYDPSVVFPDNRIAKEGETGVMMDVGMTKMAGFIGKGSLGRAAVSTIVGNAPSVDMVMNDMKNIKDPTVRAKIEDQIKEQVLKMFPPEDTRSSGPGAAAQKSEHKNSVNWQEFIESNHDLKTLMDLDPENPSPDIVPEWKELDQLEYSADVTHDRLQQTKDQVKAEGQVENAAEQANNEVKELEIEKPKYKADEVLAFANLEIGGLKLKKEPKFDKETKDAVMENNNEFDPTKLMQRQTAYRAQPSGNMG